MLTRVRYYLTSFDRRLWVLAGAWLVNGLGFSMTLPFLSLYLHVDRGVSMKWVGTVFLAAGLCRTIGQLPGGMLTDVLGPKKTIILAQLGRVASYLALAAGMALDWPLVAVGALISVSYFAGAVFQTAADVFTARITSGRQRVEAYGLSRVGLNLGWMCGPAVGAFLAKTPYSLLFLLSAGVVAVSVAAVTALVRDQSIGARPPGGGFSPREMSAVLRDGTFVTFCAAFMVVTMLMSQLVSTMSIYTTKTAGLTRFELGLLYTINGGVCILLQMPVAAWLKRFPLTASLAAGSLIYAAGYLSMAGALGFAGAATSVVIVTLGEVITNPPASALASLLSPPEKLGRNMGFFGAARGLGFALGPWIGGMLFDVFETRPLALWGSVACFGLAAAIAFVLLGRFGRIPKSPSA